MSNSETTAQSNTLFQTFKKHSQGKYFQRYQTEMYVSTCTIQLLYQQYGEVLDPLIMDLWMSDATTFYKLTMLWSFLILRLDSEEH